MVKQCFLKVQHSYNYLIILFIMSVQNIILKPAKKLSTYKDVYALTSSIDYGILLEILKYNLF